MTPPKTASKKKQVSNWNQQRFDPVKVRQAHGVRANCGHPWINHSNAAGCMASDRDGINLPCICMKYHRPGAKR